MAKKTYILTETQILRVVDDILKEEKEKIYTDFDKVWDYKLSNDQWFASKKGKNNWLSLKDYPVAIQRLNAKYNPQSISKSTSTPSRAEILPTQQTKQKSPVGDVPFKDEEEGNKFRQWVNNKYPKYAKKLNLDPMGSFNNSYIKRAYHATIGTTTIGAVYTLQMSKVEPQTKPQSQSRLYPGANPSYQDKINVENLSTTDTTDVCNIGDETTDCAQFVNNFSDAISAVGNAWEAYENGGVGKNIFSVFKKLSFPQMQKYEEIYKEIKGGGDPVVKIKRFEEELIAQNGQPDPGKLKMGDVIGLYYEPSKYHTEAFIGSATYRMWYPNDVMGKTIVRKRIGHTFNTHVGVIGTIKDGVPLVFHNIDGTLKSDPPQNLKIVWVKRPKA